MYHRRLVYEQNQHRNIVQKKKESIKSENHEWKHHQNTSKYTSRRWQERQHHQNRHERNRTHGSEMHHEKEREEGLQKQAKMKSIGWRESIAKQGGKILGRISKGILESILESFSEKKENFYFLDRTIVLLFNFGNFLVFSFQFLIFIEK